MSDIIDVGGGSVANETPHSLARISLRWMIRECFKTNSGIMFNSEALRRAGLDPATLYPFVQKRPPPLPVTGHKVERRPRTSLFSQPKIEEKSSASSACQTEEEHELHDALSPKFDQLSIKKTWWILELLPVKQRYQRGDKKWITKRWRSNLGGPRFIPKQKKHIIKVHRSVQMRMDAEYKKGKSYKPKASFENARKAGNIEWID
jgi:hypothetical protein